jgi:hypothetical protein
MLTGRNIGTETHGQMNSYTGQTLLVATGTCGKPDHLGVTQNNGDRPTQC